MGILVVGQPSLVSFLVLGRVGVLSTDFSLELRESTDLAR